MPRRKKRIIDDGLAVPAKLPPLEGFDDRPESTAGRPRRTWLWTLIAALVVVFLVVYVLFLGVRGIYDGLKDRGLENQQLAQQHYALGLAHLEKDDYEMAIAEFELALRHDSNLREARTQLLSAKEMARAQITPTSETRQDAVKLLYREAVARYESGHLLEVVAVLEELRGLDDDYQRENVETMLSTAQYQLGLTAVVENRLDQAIAHFESVLALDPDHKDAQDQLNLAHLYTAALNHWERDWSATIQALKGLYSLAPDYKDVQIRLRDAYVFQALNLSAQGDWCRAADQYAAAVEILPLESTVDERDEARIRCQATAEAPPATATPRATATAKATAQPGTETASSPQDTPQPTPTSANIGEGRIAFTSFDATRQRYDIYVMDLVKGDARLLRANASQPAFGPGGKRLAFRNLDPLHLGLAILDLPSNNVSELTTYAEDSTPTWSPDTSQILYASNKEGDRKWRLYVISPSAVRGNGEEWVFGRLPAWSSDGSRIAYDGCDERGDDCSVWVMQPGGFNPARLTTDPSDTAPAWSPDGTQVAFASARDGNWEAYLIDIATGQERRLTNNTAIDTAPAWSPDGKQIAFLSNRERTWAVYVLEVRSGQVRKIIATGDAYPDPFSERLSWIP
jgi:TolB protein